MKTSVNNRKDNVSLLLDWIVSNKLDYTTTEGRERIINRYSLESTIKAYPNKLVDSKSFKDAHRFKIPQVMRALQLLCKREGVSHTIGYVYLITNPAYPGWVKIGASVDAETRLSQYQTYSPFRNYTLEYYVICLDYIALEDRVLRQFPNRNNEWVYANLEEVKQILEEQIDWRLKLLGK
ncbi:hypothetical protein My1_054 [Pectobacterium phage My1]|uniref:Bacteriophage T5 Orf172 DNA-binding domain-containing protein n=1 Tax=Pectobacterium phage My1 TaxID=1204539 RepID=J9QM64_9CAUD|nr:hypothetical protein My1_054 [Pectobacterium phage My1]AFQ22213.1 hypothetical protein My1_054 [Pectobacterium phage My1]